MKKVQRLYWALSQPLRYLGITLDEWAVLFVGLVPGMFFINGQELKKGLIFLAIGIFGCMALKKYKKLSEHFLIKSFLVAHKILPAPKNIKVRFGKIVGR
jgi:hypothetical protein